MRANLLFAACVACLALVALPLAQSYDTLADCKANKFKCCNWSCTSAKPGTCTTENGRIFDLVGS